MSIRTKPKDCCEDWSLEYGCCADYPSITYGDNLFFSQEHADECPKGESGRHESFSCLSWEHM